MPWNPSRVELLSAISADYQMLQRECPDEVAGSYRNSNETMILSIFNDDEHMTGDQKRIRHLGLLAREGRVDPENALFFYDSAIHFRNPSLAKDAQMVAQYEQIPNKGLGRLERQLRLLLHPWMRQYVTAPQ